MGYATPAEVKKAIDGLTDVDYERLTRGAWIYLGGTDYATAEELLTVAQGVAYRAACGGEGRRWKTEVDFIRYLFMTMRGTADDDRKRAARRKVTRLSESTDLEDSIQHAGPPIDQVLTTEEEKLLDAENYKKARNHFKNDKEVCWVIKGIMEGVPAREIIKRSGMTTQAYESAHKRWRRGLETLFPGRRKYK